MELAHQGAQVMQTRAVELGWVNGVVIEVLSSFEDAPGTQIREDPLVEQRNKVRGLAHDRNVAKITLVEVPDQPGVARSVFEPLAEAGINVDMIVQNVGHGGATDLSFTIPRVELAKAKRLLEPLIRDLGFRDMTTDSSVAKVSIVGAGHPERAGLRGPHVRHARRRGNQHRDDLDLGDPDHHDHRRGPRGGGGPRAPRRVRAGAARDRRGGRRRRRLTHGDRGPRRHRPCSARVERFASVGSTNDVVRGWLAAGEPEICLAVAGEQTAGRGRARPDLDGARRGGAARVGRLPADVAAGRTGPGGWRRVGRAGDVRRRRGRRRAAEGAIRLKWPNDLVIEVRGPDALLIGELDAPAAAARLAAPLELRKLAGVLGESDGLGTDDPRVVVGIGINADWRDGRLSAGPRRRR